MIKNIISIVMALSIYDFLQTTLKPLIFAIQMKLLRKKSKKVYNDFFDMFVNEK